jgi:hypothetical protein
MMISHPLDHLKKVRTMGERSDQGSDYSESVNHESCITEDSMFVAYTATIDDNFGRISLIDGRHPKR